MERANAFRRYEQPENDLTNGLVSLLSLADVGGPELLRLWLGDCVGIAPNVDIRSFRVLEGIGSTADAELSGPDCRILIETKIASRSLRRTQVDAHLDSLRRTRGAQRRLVLLTPDSTHGPHVARFLNDKDGLVVHVSWKRIYEMLGDFVQHGQATSPFQELTRQYMECIQAVVLAHDWAGVIHKLKFGPESGLEQDTYLDWLEDRETFNTKKHSEALDGPGRILLLYDPVLKAITAHVETRRIEFANEEPGFPWAIRLVPETLLRLRQPIPLAAITAVAGLEGFGRSQTAIWKLTAQQHDHLLGETP